MRAASVKAAIRIVVQGLKDRAFGAVSLPRSVACAAMAEAAKGVWRGCVAEFIGTFALCFFGAGSMALVASQGSEVGPLVGLIVVALGHSLTLLVFVNATYPVSGAQLNPAVSIALSVGMGQPWRTTSLYILSQLLAAASGIGMLVLLFKGTAYAEALEAARHGATLGALAVGESRSVLGLLGLEALQAFALMFVILTVIVDRRGKATGMSPGFAIAGVVGACIVAFGPVTGASMNPARSFGSALYGHWEMHSAYWVGPIAGALLAAIVYRVCWVVPNAQECD